MNRREFLKALGGLSTVILGSSFVEGCARREPALESPTHTTAPHTTEPFPSPSPIATDTLQVNGERSVTRVAFVKTDDRSTGVLQAIDLLENNPMQGKKLFLKPNFNSADPAPGSTHIDTLKTLIQKLQAMGSDRITIGDRSGMGNTREVMKRKDIFRLADELGCETVVFDELENDDWEKMQVEGSHWSRGFAVARPVLEADGVVQTCCLKTHRYGGHFTMSLKNSVGLVAKTVPGEGHDYMQELHSSADQRLMIAEINAAYQPDLIVLDGVEAFVTGGPDTGKQVASHLILAGTDRVAMDAIGVAVLRYFGTTSAVEQGSIFQQEQIARAVELNLGMADPENIELITSDPESEAYAAEIWELLFAA
ncbi:MAG TPA: DUF362 domain-containing protein [Anaerolineae bacterium]|nr:DUF362 domain-containing protein [Anaerolineae bacterium]